MSARLPSLAQRKRALRIFRAVAHPDRLLVLIALGRSPVCVSDLAALCGRSQSAMSHQLRALRRAGLVQSRRRGKQIFYALRDHHVADLIQGALAHASERAG